MSLIFISHDIALASGDRRPHRGLPGRPPRRDRRDGRCRSAGRSEPYTRRAARCGADAAGTVAAARCPHERAAARAARRDEVVPARPASASRRSTSVARARARRDAGARRPFRQRQVHACPHRHAAGRAGRRPVRFEGIELAGSAGRSAAEAAGRVSRWCSRIRWLPSIRAPRLAACSTIRCASTASPAAPGDRGASPACSSASASIRRWPRAASTKSPAASASAWRSPAPSPPSPS